ncbi:MAG: type II toxin-antitoxin system RelE family toxin [Gammaproteobacteria bacterium]
MWRIEFTKRFLKDLASLPLQVRQRAEQIVFEKLDTRNPFESGLLEKMTGYPSQYKIRIGEYRIGITVDKRRYAIVCRRIAHRKEIYRFFP